MTARELAFDMLKRCEKNQQYSNIALDAAFKRTALPDCDRGLVTALMYGVLEHRITLEHQISLLSARPFEEISPEIRTLLCLGLYQLAYLDRVPDHAAVNETVELAGKRASGFVNAILRAFIRGGKKLALPNESEVGIPEALSVRYSVGVPLCRRLLDVFGREKCELILSAFSVQPPLTVRVNTLKTDRESLLARFRADGLQAELSESCSTAIRIHGNAPVTSLFGFSDGLFFVQDEASQLCVEALDARPDMQVLDTCACPGSKSFGIAISMQNRGSLISCDLHASKLSLVRSGAERLGISILQTEERDARRDSPEWIGKFDRILCDVPCSGFGVIAKKPELRYKDPAESAALPEIQQSILRASAPLLRSGGRLVYSTCTILPEENGENLSRFLAEHPEFTCLHSRTFYPDVDGTDGFFIAVLEIV